MQLFVIHHRDNTELHSDPQQNGTITQYMLTENTHAHAHTRVHAHTVYESQRQVGGLTLCTRHILCIMHFTSVI